MWLIIKIILLHPKLSWEKDVFSCTNQKLQTRMRRVCFPFLSVYSSTFSLLHSNYAHAYHSVLDHSASVKDGNKTIDLKEVVHFFFLEPSLDLTLVPVLFTSISSVYQPIKFPFAYSSQLWFLLQRLLIDKVMP
jgi:hypothetical protein